MRPVSARSVEGGVRARWFRDPYRLSLWLLILMSISRLHQVYPIIGLLRPGVVLVALAIVAAAINPRALAPWRWMRTWPAKLVGALALLAVIGAPFGISLGAAMNYFLNYYVKVLIAAFLLMAAMRGPRDLAAFTWAYVAGCAALVYMAIFTFNLSATNTGVERLSNLYTWDANDLGCVLLLGMPLTVLALQTSRGLWKIVGGVVLLGMGVALARSGSRGAFLGFAVVGLAFLFTLTKVSLFRRVSFVVIAAGALAVAAPEGYWKQMSTLTSATQDYNWTAAGGRREMAKHAIGYMTSYPVFGVGIDLFSRAEGLESDRAWRAAHNSYLEAGSELGIPGLLLWTGLVVGCIVGPWLLRRRMPPDWAKGGWEERFLYQAGLYLPLAALGFAVTSFFVSFAWLDPVYVLAAFNIGLIMSVRAKLSAGGLAPAPRAAPALRPRPWGTLKRR